MNNLVKEITKGLLEEEKRTVAVYGGGFKPPTAGHFEVVKTALEKNPNIDKFIILIGGKKRDGVTPEESIIIWDIYKQYLPINVEVKLSPKPPIQAVYNYAKEHPNEDVIFVIGAREGNEDDFKDISNRTTSVDKYPNLRVSTVVTTGGASGTAARNAAKISVEKLRPLLPKQINDEEADEIFSYINDTVMERKMLKEILDPKVFDFKPLMKSLTKSMEDDGLKLQPYPKVKFIHTDSKNGDNFFGKTAYYDPSNNEVVLYTLGRHPKDILRSYAHELIHVHQNHEDRLDGISTDNVNEDDYLEKIEREAYEKGNISFRSWTNKTLNEAVVGKRIVCDNCKWAWDIKDGGDDLYMCHKCGHDNEIKELQVKSDDRDKLFDLTKEIKEIANQFNTSLGVVKDKPQTDGLTPDKDGFTVDRIKEENEVMDYKIYCDMDGVLADFESGYEKLTGIDLKGEFKKGEDFWDPISKAGVGFWAGLKWMPGGQKLWDYIKPYNPDLLSAPSREESSRIGKAVWVKHKLPGTKLILRYAKQKQQLATPESILIDDRQINIDQWEAAGGIGILHTSADNTISQLKQLGL